jgi:hypothetical protein
MSLRSTPLQILDLCERVVLLMRAARRHTGLAASISVASLQTALHFRPAESRTRLLQRARRVVGLALI